MALEQGTDISLVASPGDHLECPEVQWKARRGSGTEWLRVWTYVSELPFLNCGLRLSTTFPSCGFIVHEVQIMIV